ncbi:MAG: DMT family transporter [Bacteroidetes bacterium]|nr:DMT family transporter [Bacteroidota bacterium]
MTHKSENKNSLTGFIIAFFGAILFSTKAIIVKKAFHDTSVDALTLLAERMIFSLPFYIAAAIFSSGKKNNVRMTNRQWMNVVLLGLAGYYLSSYFDFVGLQYVSAGLERLILFLYPTFAVLINAYYFKQKINNLQKTALVLTYVGIGIAYFGELKFDNSNPDFYWGSFLIFICAITYSFYLVGSGRMVPVLGVTKFTAYAMLSATCGVLFHFLIQKHSANLFASSTLIRYSIMLALLATVIPSFMLSYGMKKIGANNTAIITSIGPVSTILQAHFILGDRIFAEQVIGTVLVITGVIMIGWQTFDTSNG